MRYGELVTRAFSIAWRFKYLWLLGILGGADVGSGGFGANFSGLGNVPNGSSGGGTGNGSAAAEAGQAVGRFLVDNLGLIVALGVLLLLLAVAWFLLSCVTTGSLVRAAAEHDAERPFGLGDAWRAGLRTFWSILGVRLLGILLGLVVLVAIGALAALGVVTAVSGPRGGLVAVVALGIVLVPVLIVLAILAGLVLILATRAVVLEERGAGAAVGRGVQLLRTRLGRVLLAWLIQVALGFGAALAVTIALIPVILLAAGVVIAAVVAGGPLAAVAIGIPAGLVLLVTGVALTGVAGSYLSTYWTLAFRRLELDAPQPAPWPPAAYPQTPAV
jgi:hypothetical protein